LCRHCDLYVLATTQPTEKIGDQLSAAKSISELQNNRRKVQGAH
jgi:hypothetical protein